MKKFFTRILILILVIFLIDQSVSKVLDLGRPIDYAAFIDSKYEFDNLENVDILFIGDSQTADTFVPSVFENKLGKSAFNFGVMIMSPFEGYYLTKELVNKHENPPELVVLGTNANMFNYKISEGRYTPFFIDNPLNLLPLLIESESFEAFTSAGRKGYLFKPTIKRILSGEKNTKVHREIAGIENGYLQNVKHFQNPALLSNCNRDKQFFDADIIPEQKEYFIKTIEYLIEKNISVLLVHPPMHRDFFECLKNETRFNYFENAIKEIREKFDIKLFNADHTLLMNELKDEEFLNGDHVCYPGAVKFSNLLANYLQDNGFAKN
jgi:hypothetical protein